MDLDPDMSWSCLSAILEYLYTGALPSSSNSSLGISEYMEILSRAPFFGLSEAFQLKSSAGIVQFDHQDLSTTCITNIIKLTTLENCAQLFLEAREAEMQSLCDRLFLEFIVPHWSDVIANIRESSIAEFQALEKVFEEMRFEKEVESEYQFL
jgi:hypothetical protein